MKYLNQRRHEEMLMNTVICGSKDRKITLSSIMVMYDVE